MMTMYVYMHIYFYIYNENLEGYYDNHFSANAWREKNTYLFLTFANLLIIITIMIVIIFGCVLFGRKIKQVGVILSYVKLL